MAPTSHHPENEGWPEYRRLVLQFCEETKVKLEDITERLNEMDLQINTLSVKMAIIGGVCGFIASLIGIAIHYVVFKLMG